MPGSPPTISPGDVSAHCMPRLDTTRPKACISGDAYPALIDLYIHGAVDTMDIHGYTSGVDLYIHGVDRVALGARTPGPAHAMVIAVHSCGKSHKQLRRCLESTPCGLRQLALTLTHLFDWWRGQCSVHIFTSLLCGNSSGAIRAAPTVAICQARGGRWQAEMRRLRPARVRLVMQPSSAKPQGACAAKRCDRDAMCKRKCATCRVMNASFR